MKRAAIAAALLAPLLFLFACTTPTPYQPLTPGSAVAGGYSDQQLDSSHFRVTFAGNTMTSREQVETYLLYHAAQVTLSHGADWFEMADRSTENHGDTWVSSYGPGWGYWRPYWRFGWRGGWRDPFWGPGPWGGPWDYDVEHFDRFTASAEIVVGHGPKPPGDKRAFDAHEVTQNLEAKIVRPGQAPPHP
ncbi:MAG TPA: hypothetical protein VFE13_03450 [Caulobacteraceae bacterium]|jgi:hypothetical protein|nr:hypothetical protein [Caulobacteraceae bacterium]